MAIKTNDLGSIDEIKVYGLEEEEESEQQGRARDRFLQQLFFDLFVSATLFSFLVAFCIFSVIFFCLKSLGSCRSGADLKEPIASKPQLISCKLILQLVTIKLCLKLRTSRFLWRLAQPVKLIVSDCIDLYQHCWFNSFHYQQSLSTISINSFNRRPIPCTAYTPRFVNGPKTSKIKESKCRPVLGTNATSVSKSIRLESGYD